MGFKENMAAMMKTAAKGKKGKPAKGKGGKVNKGLPLDQLRRLAAGKGKKPTDAAEEGEFPPRR